MNGRYGIFCETKVEQVDRDTQIVTCPETGFEGIWSTQEVESLADLWREHAEAHERRWRHQDYLLARRQALHIYGTTEPGDPARRGIGAYL